MKLSRMLVESETVVTLAEVLYATSPEWDDGFQHQNQPQCPARHTLLQIFVLASHTTEVDNIEVEPTCYSSEYKLHRLNSFGVERVPSDNYSYTGLVPATAYKLVLITLQHVLAMARRPSA
jgi:hypothetical protein